MGNLYIWICVGSRSPVTDLWDSHIMCLESVWDVMGTGSIRSVILRCHPAHYSCMMLTSNKFFTACGSPTLLWRQTPQ